MALIDDIKNILKNEWGKVYYSQDDIDYEPHLKYSMQTDYEIYSRLLWLSYKTEFLSDDKIPSVAEYLISLEKHYISNKEKEIDPELSYRVAKKIHGMCENDRMHSMDKNDIKKVRMELRTKYSHHCCNTLTQTDNAEERYFFRLNIVYIPPLNTYVLTNNRKYVYVPDIDTYMLDQRIIYKILDFCPFCGADLKEDRIKKKESNKYILQYIEMWRNEGEGKIGPHKSLHKITRYGINCYDSYDAVSEILAEKYVKYDNEFGVDSSGSVYKTANFITVEKLFKLATKHKFYKLFDYEDWYEEEGKEIPNNKIINYFLENFSQKHPFRKNDLEILIGILRDIFWNMFHKPECFDELLEN